MSIERNKAVVRAVEEAWDRQDLDGLDQHFAPEFDNSGSALPGLPPGLEGAKIAHGASMQSFPDRKVTLGELIGEEDRVVVRARITGTNQDAIGVRVPQLTGPGAEVLARAGCVVATSANRPGEPDPAQVEDVPDEIRAGAAVVLDGGALPGTPSTVLDFTADPPTVVREGAAPVEEALARASAALVA